MRVKMIKDYRYENGKVFRAGLEDEVTNAHGKELIKLGYAQQVQPLPPPTKIEQHKGVAATLPAVKMQEQEPENQPRQNWVRRKIKKLWQLLE